MKLDSSIVKAYIYIYTYVCVRVYIYIYIYMRVYIYIYINPLRFNGNVAIPIPDPVASRPPVAAWTQFPLINTGIWPSPPHEPLQHGFNVLQAGAHHISEYSEYRIRKYEPIQLNQKKKDCKSRNSRSIVLTRTKRW